MVQSSDQNSDASIGSPTRPRVSVIMPIYNCSGTLQRALDSALAQTVKDLEIIVVDDGSSDHPASVTRSIADSRIRVIRHEKRRGAGAARNTGIENAKGSYIALFDSDDEWFSQKLEKQMHFLMHSQSQHIVCCSGFFLRRQNAEIEVNTNLGSNDVGESLLWGCTLSPGSTLIANLTCFKQVGPFDERLQRLEDWDWLLRCRRLFPVHVFPESLARIHASSEDNHSTQVFDALRLMNSRRRYYGLNWRTPIALQKFRSTLFLEQAAVHYRRGAIFSAAGYGLIAFIFYPFRNRAFFRKILTVFGHCALRPWTR